MFLFPPVEFQSTAGARSPPSVVLSPGSGWRKVPLSLFPSIDNLIVLCFHESNFNQPQVLGLLPLLALVRGWVPFTQVPKESGYLIVEPNSDIFASACMCAEVRHVIVKVLMIHNIYDLTHYEFQVGQIHNHASIRVHGPANLGKYSVVVAMSVGIIAFAKNSQVLFSRERGTMQSMSRREGLPSHYFDNRLPGHTTRVTTCELDVIE